MRILLLANDDWAGIGHATHRALQAAGHETRAVTMRQWYYDYPTDLVNPDLATLRDLLDWAEVWNLYDDAQRLIPRDVASKPTVVTYLGSWYRQEHEAWNALARERGYVQTCCTHDLCRFGPAWLPQPMEDLIGMAQREMGRVCHAPTKRAPKGTDMIISGLAGLDGITLDVIEGVTNAECLQRKARAWLSVDQIGPGALGYARNTLEGWALGMPVISWAPAEIAPLVEATVGYLPFYPAQDAAALRQAVETLRDQPEEWNRWCELGRRCLTDCHAPAVVAQRFVGFAEQAIADFKPARPAAPLVSVCMIVKDEEALLEKAVRSTVGLADEVVIVDTGSTDGTLVLAERLGARVLTGGDSMHKAESRNRGIAAARGKWVVILDADEEVADPHGLRRRLEQSQATAHYVQVDNKTYTYASMRIWLRDAYRYKYRAHEVPLPTAGWGKVEYTDFVWRHNQPPERWAWKAQYTLDRLLLDVAENPGDSRPIYYLGRQYVYLEQWQTALDHLVRYLELSPNGIDASEAHKHRARCYEKLGDDAGRINELHLAIAARPSERGAWCELAEVYYGKQGYQTALALLCGAMQIADTNTHHRAGRWFGPDTHDLAARCCWHLKRYEEGRRYARQALDMAPDDARLKKNLWWFENALGVA